MRWTQLVFFQDSWLPQTFVVLFLGLIESGYLAAKLETILHHFAAVELKLCMQIDSLLATIFYNSRSFSFFKHCIHQAFLFVVNQNQVTAKLAKVYALKLYEPFL